MQRRHLLASVSAAATAFALPCAARAQGAYPSKPVRLLVGFAAGGGIDFTARAIEPGLSAALGQPVVIDYKPGVGGVLAASEIARSAPDGYNLLIANTGPFAIAPYLQPKMPYDPARQFTYIGQIAEAGYIVATRADHPAKDLKQFVEWARANPGKANFASSGNGASTHLNGELLNAAAGIDLLHVPYKGSAPAVTDLIGGQVHVLIDAGTVLLPQVKSGRLKALAVTGSRRDANLPEVATVREQGFPGAESSGFQGLVGPAGMSKDVVDKLSGELRKLLATPEMKARFAASGSDVHYRAPQDFAAYVKAESEVTGSRRDANLPEVATVREQGFPGAESSGFQGLVGPAGMSKDVVDKLSGELRKLLATPEMKARFAASGSDVHYRAPQDFAAYVKAESEKWSALIAKRNIKLD